MIRTKITKIGWLTGAALALLLLAMHLVIYGDSDNDEIKLGSENAPFAGQGKRLA